MQIIRGIKPKPLKCVVYGPEGVGKSTFAAQAPNPLFIDTEGGTDRLDVARLPVPSSLSMLMEQLQWVKNNVGCCQTLVLDTADWAERLCIESVCQAYQKKGIEDFAYGKGYIYAYEAFGKILNMLDEILAQGVHIIVNAHAAMRKFELPDENGAYDRWELKLIASQKCSIANMLKEWADMIFFCNFETIVIKDDKTKKAKGTGGTRRVMYTSHHACWDAKNRFNLPDKLPFEYAQVANLFSANTPMAQAPAAQMPVAPPPAANPEPPAAAAPVPATAPQADDSSFQKVDGYDPNFPWTLGQQNAVESTIPSFVPKALADLMASSNVTVEEITNVVAQRGYYPAGTPFQNYDPQFVEGVLIAAWPQVLDLIQSNRKA